MGLVCPGWLGLFHALCALTARACVMQPRDSRANILKARSGCTPLQPHSKLSVIASALSCQSRLPRLSTQLSAGGGVRGERATGNEELEVEGIREYCTEGRQGSKLDELVLS